MKNLLGRIRDPRMTVHGRAGMVGEAADEIERQADVIAAFEILHEERSAEIDRLEGLCATLQQQAQIHAQEARTHKTSLHECYQAATGKTGEPGSWNGAKPVVEAIDRLTASNAELVEMLSIMATYARLSLSSDNEDFNEDYSRALITMAKARGEVGE